MCVSLETVIANKLWQSFPISLSNDLSNWLKPTLIFHEVITIIGSRILFSLLQGAILLRPMTRTAATSPCGIGEWRVGGGEVTSKLLGLYSLRIRRLTLRWRHNDHAGVSNHQPPGCLLNRLFRRKSKKTSKLRVTGLCAGNSPGTGEFSAQMASYAENVSIWWRHHVSIGIPIIILRRSSDRLRFIMGIPLPVRRRLLSE